MKKKSLSKLIALLTASVFSLTYLFLIPLARINLSQAQQPDVPEPTRTQVVEKRVSKLYIPTGASSTFMKTSDGEEHLLIQDHITSTRIIESNKGTQQQEYYPYGMTSGEPTTLTDKQFTSHRSLADTGVYHAGARFYNPEMGMFVSADKVQGPNRYMYAAANPTVYTDPSGKIVPLVIAAIIIGGGAFGAGFGTGFERGRQVTQYGSVQEPASVVAAGIAGGVAGASVGYLGAVAAPAAIGAMSAGAGATSSVGLLGGAQIGVGACLSNPHCMNAFEAGAQLATGADAPTLYRPDVLRSETGYEGGIDNRPLILSGRHVRLYKGMSAGWDGGPILPGGLYTGKSGVNLSARGTPYQVGELSPEFSSDKIYIGWIINHALQGQTAKTPFSSWTEDLEVARAYAGPGGCVISCVFDKSEIIDLREMLLAGGDHNPFRQYLSFPDGTSLLDYATTVEGSNARRIVKEAHEGLFFGIVPAQRVSVISRGTMQ